MIDQQGKRHQRKSQNKDKEDGRAIRAIIFGKIQATMGTGVMQTQIESALIKMPLMTFRAAAGQRLS